MPKRLTKEEVEKQINNYGFFFVPDTVYKNSRTAMKIYDAEQDKIVNLSLDQINYRRRKNYRGEYDIFNLVNSVLYCIILHFRCEVEVKIKWK